MAKPIHKYRDAGCSEKRCIVRHELGFYQNLLVSGIYSFSKNLADESNLLQPSFYEPALETCIDQHPMLSSTIGSPESEQPFFARLDSFSLTNHIQILQSPDNCQNADNTDSGETMAEQTLIQETIRRIHNEPECAFNSVNRIPPWKIHVMILPERRQLSTSLANHYRVLIIFAYSHSHGDGMSGIAFHRTFLAALDKQVNSLPTNETTPKKNEDRLTKQAGTAKALHPPVDAAGNLPVDLSYLLKPALGTYLPSFLTKPFGITPSLSGVTASTWTGKPAGCNSSTTPKARTGINTMAISARDLTAVLARCRANNCKLTAFLDHAVANAFSQALRQSNVKTAAPRLEQYSDFASVIAINLRKALGIPETTIGVFASAAYFPHPLTTATSESIDTEHFWHSVRRETEHLQDRSTTLRNQPIGLLRYVNNFRTWTLQNSRGSTRDASWEISNLMSFSPSPEQNQTQTGKPVAAIERLYFSQAASPTGPAVAFNTVSAASPAGDGDLVICVTWQVGMLGIVPDDAEVNEGSTAWDEIERYERTFIEQLCRDIKEVFSNVAGGTIV